VRPEAAEFEKIAVDFPEFSGSEVAVDFKARDFGANFFWRGDFFLGESPFHDFLALIIPLKAPSRDRLHYVASSEVAMPGPRAACCSSCPKPPVASSCRA
jgi:hypothetical protein